MLRVTRWVLANQIVHYFFRVKWVFNRWKFYEIFCWTIPEYFIFVFGAGNFFFCQLIRNQNFLAVKCFRNKKREREREVRQQQQPKNFVHINLDILSFKVVFYLNKMGHSRPLILYYRLFKTVDRKQKFFVKFANDLIQTAELWCRKKPLYQLVHNHRK